MPEYVESEAVMKTAKDGNHSDFGRSMADLTSLREVREDTPAADVVEVVRCKNCKYFCPYEGEEHKGDCAELVGLESCVYEDDFCSYGERKDGDE